MKISKEHISQYAAMLTAMGAEARLRIMRLLISAHPDGMVVGEIQSELEIAGSTLSHHLEKLKHAGLVTVRREHQFLRYAAATEKLEKLLSFLFEECCSRSKACQPVRQSLRPRHDRRDAGARA